jgi:hypothetical protein
VSVARTNASQGRQQGHPLRRALAGFLEPSPRHLGLPHHLAQKQLGSSRSESARSYVVLPVRIWATWALTLAVRSRHSGGSTTSPSRRRQTPPPSDLICRGARSTRSLRHLCKSSGSDSGRGRSACLDLSHLTVPGLTVSATSLAAEPPDPTEASPPPRRRARLDDTQRLPKRCPSVHRRASDCLM